MVDFQSRVENLRIEDLETFASADGTRTVSRLRLTGTNNGMMGLPADGRPFTLTANSILACREDGKILQNWVERNIERSTAHSPTSRDVGPKYGREGRVMTAG
ncbi:ester cyclase [Hyphomicrobium sp. 99]|uniref:ester cyclase n=1 Tax=Hyphomicrobium sp. 99 TaxID=1163419 RepID=UPI003529A470